MTQLVHDRNVNQPAEEASARTGQPLVLAFESGGEDLPPASAMGRLRNGFVEGMRNASGTLLGLAVFTEEFGPAMLIWFTILGLPAYLVWRRYRRTRATT